MRNTHKIVAVILAFTTPALAMGGRSDQKQQLQELCAELSNTEGGSYEYMEGKLIGFDLFVFPADCFKPGCPSQGDKAASYRTVFRIKNQDLHMSIFGTVSSLEQLSLKDKRTYAFCKTYDPTLLKNDGIKKINIAPKSLRLMED